MAKPSTTKYLKHIRLMSIITDITVITILDFLLYDTINLNKFFLFTYQIFSWFTITFFTKFYGMYNFTKPLTIISKIIKQSIIFTIALIIFFYLSNSLIRFDFFLIFFIISTLFISLFKFLFYFIFKKLNRQATNNYKNVIIIGYSKEALQLKILFEIKKELGYKFLGYFSDKKEDIELIGKLEDVKSYVIENDINEIYCSLKETPNELLKEFIKFAEENNKIIKFIPDTKEIFSKNLIMDYYDFFPVLSLKKTSLEAFSVKLFKRIFDIVFSFTFILLVFSWLLPLLAILIKLESKGPVFFKQGRPGMNENEFNCYKFRSMQINKTSELETSKNDPRVTNIGRFMRKTSLDETPQFLNVLIGDMSVVGPRPHLWSQNRTYGNKISKYMKRHYVKPGITGLAQVSGYRGSIGKDIDMINRIKLDIFYIENWSFILDLKIIFQTFINIFKGEENAF